MCDYRRKSNYRWWVHNAIYIQHTVECTLETLDFIDQYHSNNFNNNNNNNNKYIQLRMPGSLACTRIIVIVFQ